ncbi:unnamed protein product [Lasius platythorax]|uniref:Uncharacterized protein n=1 Tax=Lasius platythorax TaxID=488582 RepID=A0AAV2NKL0_9HYME
MYSVVGSRRVCSSFTAWNLLKESLSPYTRRSAGDSLSAEEEKEEMVVVVENDKEVEGQRRTKKEEEEEEDHVILLWYTSSVPGSDVPLTWHTLQLASLQDPEEWVCLSYGSDRASLAVYYPRVYLSRHEIRAIDLATLPRTCLASTFSLRFMSQ